MLVDFKSLKEQYAHVAAGKESQHTVRDRFTPSILRYDYLALSRLRRDIETLIDLLPTDQTPRLALDLGCGKSPYKSLLERRGYQVQTFDTDATSGATFLGIIEDTRLPSCHFDLVVCTQVLEHCTDPFEGTREINLLSRTSGSTIRTLRITGGSRRKGSCDSVDRPASNRKSYWPRAVLCFPFCRSVTSWSMARWVGGEHRRILP
jgi:SAM-dependent methyltransferase